ncbi:hypothetical protein BESB_013410 [Besnoitia besnoiti]|uniref:WD domain, G-beta repeat-containing protein n=1 Tax=Besnoitia besnoiti TaxID=94643 RepID=A0A2A9M451_BESBE|nr:hypothetical protein BESB_013410 [Besnoitia besnoiti]PFH32729.1 hypothetical protein BESB_013410 [Besnoitia besnoiti]
MEELTKDSLRAGVSTGLWKTPQFGRGTTSGPTIVGGARTVRPRLVNVSTLGPRRQSMFANVYPHGGHQKLSSPRTARHSIYSRAGRDRRQSDLSAGCGGSPVEWGASTDQSERGPRKFVAFHVQSVRRHKAFWSEKMSVRSATESPPEIMCAHFDISERNLFLGLSTGTVMLWKEPFSSAPSSDEQSSNNNPSVLTATGHTGTVSSLIFLKTLAPDRALREDREKPRNETKPSANAAAAMNSALARSGTVEEELGFLFTGSADRSIKLWVVEPRKLVCVRTLCSHGGAIVALAYCFPYLFSASTDGTVLIFRTDPTADSLKHPQFAVAARIFAHSIYHPTTKLALSNKKAWYNSLAARCNGDRISLYCGSTDGALLVLDNTQTNVPANPVVGGGGAPPACLHTQERASVWMETRERAGTALGGGRLYSSLLCNTSYWGSLLTQEVRHDSQAPGENLLRSSVPAVEVIRSVVLPVPFRIQSKLPVHALGLRKVYSLPLESALATLGSEASISVVDPVAGQVSWKEENPEGCCYSACAWITSFNLLLVGDDYGCLSFYNVYSKERVHSQQVAESRILSLCNAKESSQVIAVTAHELLLVDLVETTEEVVLSGHQGVVTNLFWQSTPDGGYVYSASDDKTIRQWDVQKRQCTRVLRHKHPDISSWMLLDNLNGFVTGHEDGDVRFWSLKDFTSFSVHNQKGHHIHINSVTGMCSWRPGLAAKYEGRRRSRAVAAAVSGDAGSVLVPSIPATPSVDRETSPAPHIYQMLTCGYDGRLNVTEIRADGETGEVTTKFIVRCATYTRRA